MMARCAVYFVFIVLLFALTPLSVGAELRPISLLVAGRQIDAACQAYLDDDGSVKAPVELLKVLDASYVAGDNRVTVINDGKSVELRIVKRLGRSLIDVADVAKALGFVYEFEKDSKTVQIKARLISFEFADGRLKAVFDLPVQPSAVRMWQDPWRLSIDVRGAVVAVAERSLNVASADVSGVRAVRQRHRPHSS